MVRTIQVAFALVAAGLMLSTASPSTAKTTELRSHHSAYVDQLGPRAPQWRRDNSYHARAKVPAFRNGPVVDDPPGSAFQDQGERDSIGD